MLTTVKDKSRVISLQERIQTNTTGKIDHANGIIRGVKILGKVSKNGREYSEAAMKQAVGLYEGTRVNFDHPDKATPNASRSVKDWIGELRNVSKKGDGVYGDLHLIKSHPHAAAVMEAAEKFPTKFGLSHNAVGPTRRDGNKTIVEGLQSVRSVDLVQNPATNNSLFESVQGDTKLKTQQTALSRRITGIMSYPGHTTTEKLRKIKRAIGEQELAEMDGSPEIGASDPHNIPPDEDATEMETLITNIKVALTKPNTPDNLKLQLISDMMPWAPDEAQPDDVPDSVPESYRPSLMESLTGRPAPGSTAAKERAERIKRMSWRYR